MLSPFCTERLDPLELMTFKVSGQIICVTAMKDKQKAEGRRK